LPNVSEVEPEDTVSYLKCLVTLDLAEECVCEDAHGSPPYRLGPFPMLGNVDAVRLSMESLWTSGLVYGTNTDLVRTVLGAASRIDGVLDNREDLRALRAFVESPLTGYPSAQGHATRNPSTWTKFRSWFDGGYPRRKFHKDAADAIRAVVPWPVVAHAWEAYCAAEEAGE
jgi:hypothetical protein